MQYGLKSPIIQRFWRWCEILQEKFLIDILVRKTLNFEYDLGLSIS